MKTDTSLRRTKSDGDVSQVEPRQALAFRGALDSVDPQRVPSGHDTERPEPRPDGSHGKKRPSLDITREKLPTVVPKKDYEPPDRSVLDDTGSRPPRRRTHRQGSFAPFAAPPAALASSSKRQAAEIPGPSFAAASAFSNAPPDDDVLDMLGALPRPIPSGSQVYELEEVGGAREHAAADVRQPNRAAQAHIDRMDDFARGWDEGEIRPEHVRAGDLATLLEEVRPYRTRISAESGAHPLRAPEEDKDFHDGRGVTGGIDDAKLKELLGAAGWKAADIAAFENASFWSGAYNAVLPQLLNNTSLSISSFVGAATHDAPLKARLASPVVNVAFSLVIGPPLVAVAKMRTSPMADDHRLRNGPQMKLDSNEINAEHWPSKFAGTVHGAGKDLERDAETFVAELTRVLGDVPDGGTVFTPRQLDQLDGVKASASRLQQTAGSAALQKERLLVAQAYHGYNEAGNKRQRYTRMERSTGNALTKFVSAKDKPYPGFEIPEEGSPHAPSPYTAPGIALVNGVGNLGAGVTAAMYDELDRRKTEMKLPFAYSYAFFKTEKQEEGRTINVREQIRLGKPIEESDIDVDAVAALQTTFRKVLYEIAMKEIDEKIIDREGRIGTADEEAADAEELHGLREERGLMERKEFRRLNEAHHLPALLQVESNSLLGRWRDDKSLLGTAIAKRVQDGDFWTQLSQNYAQTIGGGIGSLTTNSVSSFVSAAVGSARLNPAITAGEAVGIGAASWTNGVYYAGNVNAKDWKRANEKTGVQIKAVPQFLNGSFLYASDAWQGIKNVIARATPIEVVTERSAHRVVNESLRLAQRLLPLARQISPPDERRLAAAGPGEDGDIV